MLTGANAHLGAIVAGGGGVDVGPYRVEGVDAGGEGEEHADEGSYKQKDLPAMVAMAVVGEMEWGLCVKIHGSNGCVFIYPSG